MALRGGIAGLVAVPKSCEIREFKLGFSPDYGLWGSQWRCWRAETLGVLAAAFLFGALHKGTRILDLETDHVTRDLSLILQALVILSVSAEAIWRNSLNKDGPDMSSNLMVCYESFSRPCEFRRRCFLRQWAVYSANVPA